MYNNMQTTNCSLIIYNFFLVIFVIFLRDVSDFETKTYSTTADNDIITTGPTSGLSRFLHCILLIIYLFQ